jgi:hypothetical protein
MRAERQIVELFRQVGLEAYRVPLSGVSAGFKSDVEVRIGSRTLRLESKVRAKEFTLLYRWLFGVAALVVKADRKPSLIILSLEEFAILLGQNRSQTENAASKPPAKPSPGTVTLNTSPNPISVDPNLVDPAKLGCPSQPG